MQISGAPPWATIGALIAILVLLLAVLGALGVLGFTPTVVFLLIAGLALARLL